MVDSHFEAAVIWGWGTGHSLFFQPLLMTGLQGPVDPLVGMAMTGRATKGHSSRKGTVPQPPCTRSQRGPFWRLMATIVGASRLWKAQENRQ